MDLLRTQGYAKLNLGAPDTRTPHAEGKFPTPSGKCEILLTDAKISWRRHFVNCTTRCRVASRSNRFPAILGHTRARPTSLN